MEIHRIEKGVQGDREVRAETRLVSPKMYRVIMHNDDYTPMDFVVAVLELFFHMDRAEATGLMKEVHASGQAVCGLFSRDVAETKVEQVVEYARTHEHPLLCSVEEGV